jgi:pimeloyl-ACP methyl ester carboxylesterase
MARLARLVCGVLVSALACGEPSPSGDDGSSTTGTSEGETDGPGYTVELRERGCPFAIPDGRTASCYTLVVPLDRGAPERGDAELPVAVLHPATAATRPPVVYFHGGPGGDVFARADAWFDRDAARDGDLIVFDQRGSGAATPSLDCPELEAGWLAAFSIAGTPEQELAVLADAYADCHARLSAEVDLSWFDTETIAADVEELRVALGLDSWSVYGISYGSRVALEVMRRDGEHVRNAVLDSVYPPEVGGVGWMVESAEEALDRMSAGCLAEPLCSATFPNLAADLDAAVASLDATPYAVSFTDSHGDIHELQLTGADFHAGMYNALYDVELIPVVPLLIFQAAQGNFGFLVDLAAQSVPQLTRLAEGARLSIDCADAAPLFAADALAPAIAEHPRFATLFGAYALPYCELWDVESASPEFVEPVVSDIPTLLLAGEFDPVTPAAHAELAAASLANSHVYVFPGYGHGVSVDSSCAAQMAGQFLRDAAADDACWSALPHNTF